MKYTKIEEEEVKEPEQIFSAQTIYVRTVSHTNKTEKLWYG